VDTLRTLRGQVLALDTAPLISLLYTPGLRVVPLTLKIAEEAARLRANYNLSAPDVIQLATAVTENATIFLTNDRRLPQLPSLTVLLADNL
jgi:predicted nucleic acid-binding protein